MNTSDFPNDLHAPLFSEIDRTLDQANELLNAAGHEPLTANARLLSFVIPVKDEQETISKLAEGISANVPLNMSYEIIFIDDGSRDGSWEAIQALCQKLPRNIRGIKFRHNAGKATSLAAGFQAARGEIVFTMDADLQDDPKEIPRFIAQLAEGYDLVSGWKKVRHDPWHKVLPSRVFNVFASALGGVKLHDHNCGFKCYRRQVVQSISLHGELHRVTPSLANMQGFRCSEIVVNHLPRLTGQSKYGLERILRGLCDVTTTGFLRRFRERPAHFFNGIAGMQFALGACSLAAGIHQWTQQRPTQVLIALGAVLWALASFSFLLGLLAELVIRGPRRAAESLPIQCDTGIHVDDKSRSQSESLVIPTLPTISSTTIPLST